MRIEMSLDISFDVDSDDREEALSLAELIAERIDSGEALNDVLSELKDVRADAPVGPPFLADHVVRPLRKRVAT